MQNSSKTNEVLPVRREFVPQELQAIQQWVCWKLLPPQNGGKPRKMPVNPRTGEPAAIDDPNTWTSFDEALDACNQHGYDGVWLALTPDLGLVAWDFDDCVVDNRVPDWLTDIINKLRSYTELSPSREGIRIICRGRLPEGRRRTTFNGTVVEVYDQARFISVTGAVLRGLPNTIEQRQREIDAVYHQLFGKRDAQEKSQPDPESNAGASLEQALERDHLFRALWNGVDYSTLGYPSQSEADAALMSKLWFWTGGDRERTLELFRHSAYGQREKAHRDDYLQRTLDAVATGDVYQRPKNGKRAEQADQPIATNTLPSELDNIIRPLNTVQPRTVEWLFPNLLARGEITILAGEAGVGKTTLALEIAHGLTKQASILDKTFQPVRAKVCWLHFDHSADRLREKYEVVFSEPPSDSFVVPDLDTLEKLGMLPLSQQTVDMWTHVLKRYEVEVLVVDTLLDLFRLDDADKTAKAQAAMQALRTLVDRTGIAVLAIAHPNKASGQRRVTSLANSLAFGAKADVVAFLVDDDSIPHDDRRCILRVVKNRSGERWEATYERRGGTFIPVGEIERPRTLGERIVDFIRMNGPSTRKKLLDAFGDDASESTLDRQLKSLVRSGALRETRTGRNNLERVYYLPHQRRGVADKSHFHHSIYNDDEIDEIDENENLSLCGKYNDNNPISSMSSISSRVYGDDEIASCSSETCGLIGDNNAADDERGGDLSVFLLDPEKEGVLEQLSRWLLDHFGGRTLAGVEVIREALDYWRDDGADACSLYTSDDIRAAVCQLLDTGLVQRVMVDGVALYRFPSSVDGEGQVQSLSQVLLERFANRSASLCQMLRILGCREDDLRLALRALEERGLIRRRGNWFQFPPVGQPKWNSDMQFV